MRSKLKPAQLKKVELNAGARKTPKAELDLIDIWLYVAEDQPAHADTLLERLNEVALLIAETPDMGVDRPILCKDIKSFPVGNYIL